MRSIPAPISPRFKSRSEIREENRAQVPRQRSPRDQEKAILARKKGEWKKKKKSNKKQATKMGAKRVSPFFVLLLQRCLSLTTLLVFNLLLLVNNEQFGDSIFALDGVTTITIINK